MSLANRDKFFAKVIREHYGLDRPVTSREIAEEINNLCRKQRNGLLDDRQQRLWSALHLGYVRI